ncbi:hypothetical protein K437DRAFT_271474 [Tilletiaria anomala UBC 951]|uniref:Uncharacterized protein n=1 Tax=Tilletiaria anomala (strain ATCC 24038 / CBS 436.72 / UBC 951) TaxID=1037660 RepID=A0A066WHR1_TILAU|nr:uncharacterized protein K437DRAFT_271474 [Tilletiaria anomala UBC 951]KDN53547.1 hypothetical protein K437DRAFT_271474 [Tilletiaria anomala UBC 951]
MCASSTSAFDYEDRCKRILVLAPFKCKGAGDSQEVARARRAAIHQARAVISIISQGDDCEGVRPATTQHALNHDNEEGSARFEVSMQSSDQEENTHPVGWVIDNKYYTACVHFLVQPLQLPPHISRRSRMSSIEFSLGTTHLQEAVQDVKAILVCLAGLNDPKDQEQLSEILDKSTDTEELEVAMVLSSGSSHHLVVQIAGEERANAIASTNMSNKQWCSEDLFSTGGWEFVDLFPGADGIFSDEHLRDHDGDGDGYADSASGRSQEDGVERVRHALMSHMWPGLQRKLPIRQTKDLRPPPPSSALSHDTAGFSSTAAPRFLADEGMEGCSVGSVSASELPDDVDLLLQGLPDGSMGTGMPHAEPTAEDEALASAFLEQIRSFESSTLADGVQHDAASTAQRLLDAQRNLERFLEQEDANWSGTASATSRRAPDTTFGPSAFDDDFAEFVSTSVPSSTDEASFEFDMGRGLDLVTLEALQGEAQRVRTIGDEETREVEAARLALALASLLTG